MESSSRSSTRFRFRDDSESEIAARPDSDSSSISSDLTDDVGGDDDEFDLESMTGKGIKHICSELQELKLESNEEFHRNIFSNYTVFIRMFKELKCLENELEQLKSHFSTQKVLVKGLVDIACSSEEAMDLVVEKSELDEPWCSNELEDHINNASEILEILMLENRIEEALDVIDLEEENFRIVQFEDSCSLDDLRFYNSVISERKADLALKLTRLAENPRISPPELQKTLLGLCRLGENDRATQLMLDYYDARIANGIHDLQPMRSFSDGFYIKELSKFVFSLISQAARSFVILGGEASPNRAELSDWAKKETKAYADCFSQYLKSVMELSGGLPMAVQAVRVSMSFCSLLEPHRLSLRPYLVQHIGLAIDEVLNANVEHFKKVIVMFSASDSWALGRYLVSGVTNERCYSVVLGQETECCMLTSSGLKFARLIKTVTEDVAPLFSLQLESSIFSGLVNLFKEYVLTLEKALFYDSDVAEKEDSRFNLAMSLQQQISILANLSALEKVVPRMVRHIHGWSHQNNSDYENERAISYQSKEIDTLTLFAQEASSQLRARFCRQYVTRIMSLETSFKLSPETGSNVQAMPTDMFQTMFLELRKIERLAEGNAVEKEWLSEILRELVETAFACISTNCKDIWATGDQDLTLENSLTYKQFVLDLQFLVEIIKYGGYFSNHPLHPENLIKSAILSAGIISERDINDNENSVDYFNEVIQKLLEIEKTTMLPNDELMNTVGSKTIAIDNSIQEEDGTSFLENSMDSDVDMVATNELGTVTIAITYSLNEEYSSPRGESQSD